MGEGSFSAFFENFDFGGDTCEEKDKLYLNCSNSFVKLLSLEKSLNRELAGAVVKVIYTQALLAGHYTLNPEQTVLMNEGLRSLMEFALRGGR